MKVRQRFFDDEAGLERWCRDLMYLPEPVAVVFAGHGTTEVFTACGKPVDTGRLLDSLRYADNMKDKASCGISNYSSLEILNGANIPRPQENMSAVSLKLACFASMREWKL